MLDINPTLVIWKTFTKRKYIMSIWRKNNLQSSLFLWISLINSSKNFSESERGTWKIQSKKRSVISILKNLLAGKFLKNSILKMSKEWVFLSSRREDPFKTWIILFIFNNGDVSLSMSKKLNYNQRSILFIYPCIKSIA